MNRAPSAPFDFMIICIPQGILLLVHREGIHSLAHLRRTWLYRNRGSACGVVYMGPPQKCDARKVLPTLMSQKRSLTCPCPHAVARMRAVARSRSATVMQT